MIESSDASGIANRMKSRIKLVLSLIFYKQVFSLLINLKHLINSISQENSGAIAGEAVRSGNTINIQDLSSDSRFNVNTKRDVTIKSIICVPVSGRNEIVGVLQMVNKKDGLFSKLDEAILEVFANHCLLGFKHNMLHQKLIKNVSTFNTYDILIFPSKALA